jgi:hypothetical protein
MSVNIVKKDMANEDKNDEVLASGNVFSGGVCRPWGLERLGGGFDRDHKPAGSGSGRGAVAG